MHFMDSITKDTEAGSAIPLGLRGTEIDLYVAYLNLTNPKQRVFEDLLLEHLLFRRHLGAYIKTTQSANDLRDKIARELSQATSSTMAGTWVMWAFEMSEKKRSAEFVDHTIFDSLRASRPHQTCGRAY